MGGGKGEVSSKNMYKGHMDKAKGGSRCVWLGWVEVVGAKWRQLYLNDN